MYATNKTARKNRAPQASAVHGRLNKIGLVILIACSTQNTWAVAVDWNAATGDWMAADNWIPAQIPTSADITVIANNGTAIVSTPGAQTLALFLGYKMVGNQILNQSGNLLINQGGTLSSIVRNSSFTIGNAIQNATSSMLTVDGPGSLLKGNGGVLINGNGGISVTNGGHIELSANPILFNGTDTGNVKLTGLNGNSTLTVSGANSIFQVDPSTNPTAALNQIILGSSDASLTPHPGFSTANSAGILTLADHGQVNAADGILFGQINSVSSGVINIGTGGAAGILNTSSIGFGSSNSQGILNFNHSDSNYYFTDNGQANGKAIAFNVSTAPALTNPFSFTNFVINQIGSGTTHLLGDNTLAGQLNVQAGTLSFDGGTNDFGAIQVNILGGTLEVNGGTLNGPIAPANIFVRGDNAAMIVTGGAQVARGGFFIDGNGSMTVTGAGTNVRASGFVIGGPFVPSGRGSLIISEGASVSSQNLIDIGRLSDGSVTVTGAGSLLALHGIDTIGLIAKGTLTVADGGKVISGVNSVSAINLGSVTGTGTGVLNIGNGGAAGIVNASSIAGGNVNALSNVNFNHTDSHYFFTSDGTAAGVGDIITGNISVNQIGSGSTTLLGANDYSGGTNVNAGTLLVNGSITGHAEVNQGGTLGGNGTLGDVVVNQGGILAPGNTGLLTLNNLTVANGGLVKLEIDGAAQGLHDDLQITHNLAFNGSLNLNFGNGFTPFAGELINLFNFGSFSGAFDPATINISGIDPNRVNLSQLALNGDIQINAVPLPTAIWFFLTGMLGLLYGTKKNLPEHNYGNDSTRFWKA